MYSLKQAAEAAGRGKPAILKAIKSGRVSAKKNDLGQWQIDPAELHRVYPPVAGNTSGTGSGERQETPKEPLEIKLLEIKVEALEQQLNRERETVNDLRRRLDAESEERRTANEECRKLTMMLTDQRPKKKTVLNRIFGINKQRVSLDEQ